MRIAHCADLHLGHIRYPRMTPDGRRNQREQDVSDNWTRAIDGILAANVQLVCIAGDLFDVSRPSNQADADAAHGVRRLVQARIPVVIVSGNHDEPSDGASPLAVLSHLGAKVVVRAERVSLPALNCHVLCVPERDVMRVALTPSTASGMHLLCAHGRFSASLYKLPEAECRNPDEISADFAYAALGDFHVPTEVKPRCWYSGAIEAVSSNPWGEIGTRYGWNLFDTETGTVARHELPSRPHIDLEPFSAAGLGAKEITAQVLAHLSAVNVEGAVVRQLIHDMPRGVRRAMDIRALRKATETALHFQLDERRPMVAQVGRPMVSVPATVEDGPDAEWLATLNDDAPLPTNDDFSLADRIARGDMPSFAELMADADPYRLNELPLQSKEAA